MINLQNSSDAIRMVIKTLSLMLVFTVVFCTLSDDHWNGLDKENDTGFKFFINRLYFTSTTFSTVGYGDISPKSVTAKCLVMLLQILVSIVVLDHLRLNIFRSQ